MDNHPHHFHHEWKGEKEDCPHCKNLCNVSIKNPRGFDESVKAYCNYPKPCKIHKTKK
jgi:hypothetical protein